LREHYPQEEHICMLSDKWPNRSYLRGAAKTKMAEDPALPKSVIGYYYEYQEANGPPLRMNSSMHEYVQNVFYSSICVTY